MPKQTNIRLELCFTTKFVKIFILALLSKVIYLLKKNTIDNYIYLHNCTAFWTSWHSRHCWTSLKGQGWNSLRPNSERTQHGSHNLDFVLVYFVVQHLCLLSVYQENKVLLKTVTVFKYCLNWSFKEHVSLLRNSRLTNFQSMTRMRTLPTADQGQKSPILCSQQRPTRSTIFIFDKYIRYDFFHMHFQNIFKMGRIISLISYA